MLNEKVKIQGGPLMQVANICLEDLSFFIEQNIMFRVGNLPVGFFVYRRAVI